MCLVSRCFDRFDAHLSFHQSYTWFTVFSQTIAGNTLVGSYCCFTNQGGVVHPQTTIQDLDELSSLLQVGDYDLHFDACFSQVHNLQSRCH